MKDRKRRERELVLSGTRLFWCFLALLLFCGLCCTSFFSTVGVSVRPVLLTSGRNPSINAVAIEYNSSHEYSTRRRIFRQSPLRLFDAVVFPDHILVFVNVPSDDSPGLDNLQCLFYGPNSPNPDLTLPLISIDGQSPLLQIARCPLPPRRLTRVSLREDLPPSALSRTWQALAYKALIDAIDNTTVVFVKGVHLRAEKLAEPSRFECVYGWNFTRGRFLRAAALSVAQEIVRCPTPRVLLNQPRLLSSVKVSVNVKGRGIFPSVARPDFLPGYDAAGSGRIKPYNLCVCTMVRNQAKFLHEWIMYHARVGVERWFIYDNNSDDGLESVARSLDGLGYNVSVHDWPWIKTQEAGFAHCALRARDTCEWVGFIDVDEFLHLPSNETVHDVLKNHSDPWVGELRTSCLSFGPSGLKRAPLEGVTVGYSCRMAAPERHKSIVRPEALNSTLVNVVHHFHLKEGYDYVNVERGAMVINHYKYQVWEVFKEKFYRRVATFVADWQENENEGSKDRAPGLGTRAVEPPDWSSRFCEVTDNGLRDWVLQEFMDPQTRLLPWQDRLNQTDTLE
ncbi:glycosyltransferase family 92 protein RCOM_0530710-like [Aristolochia californica]|uniref:glycosyltransferase family 92 protein RCOM_0530710-like n=1 Tax=Aristolochia californica TaxID=171875 RepID=UPI0035DC5BEC